MYSQQVKICWFLIALAALTVSANDSAKPDVVVGSNQPPAGPSLAVAPVSQPSGPEPRQISSAPISGSAAAVYPYNVYQNQVYGNNGYMPQTPSSGGSVLSILRPIQGGRRSSFTNRLRNLMSALFFRRETSSPYLGSGSSYSYAYRQPPLGFSSSNYYGSASNRYPVVFPSYGSNGGSNWSNYKQWSSTGSQSIPASVLNSQLSGTNGANYAWSSSNGSPTNSAYSYGAGSSNNAYPSNYQVAASNQYPSTVYGASSSYPSSTYVQRASVNHKAPVGSVGAAYPSPGVSSSSSNPSQTASQNNNFNPISTGNNKSLSSYSQ